MGTMIINVNKRELHAIEDSYVINNLLVDFILNIMANDELGITPTNISKIVDVDFTLGDLIIESDSIKFTPNGTIGTSQFQYEITDSELNTSQTIVTITTI